MLILLKISFFKRGWIYDHEHPMLPYLSQLVSSITNLTMSTAEAWQVVN